MKAILLILSLFLLPSLFGDERSEQPVTLSSNGIGKYAVRYEVNGRLFIQTVDNSWLKTVKAMPGSTVYLTGYANRNCIEIAINEEGVSIPAYNKCTIKKIIP